MNKTAWVLLLVLCAWSAGSMAQAPAEQGKKCPASLPYPDGDLPDCTPLSAAAYDFAFCSVSYQMIALSAPEADKALGEKGRSAAFSRKGNDYAMISALLSNGEALQGNVALAQKYYDSLMKRENVYIRLSLDTINLKCESLEAHHSETLADVERALKASPRKR